ncbi:30S ribosomal protein S4e [Candidatus Marsarchaeota G2 archaeon OSP_D]|jgi:Ribosomal protein S4E|uniref:Small ribosomal subunit protein eS4 n=5 Tax=Candidatus Marsarchaeota group 2 TaxID=2203771 RepID=A0A2R6BDV0_9ARCH|nr:MAG: 30S ribosomal protein S4e [Candidatus Marsarchaeota G2 archaeon OSP_D]PSN96812.1 MAG: 30S ribosomal protein S4e [Candidatus Marsarchaeota G2 archaeon ECH_B_2]PSO01381.1 MAG: 30S ribosomal protein S4e [Candidatus Marsarchaeota G2 archaeon ECH_B_3]PSO03513.1 MAG: 30S ribosomal protein S4e [Candidatus Marsarchaeota G2 archaeon ECH_B_1]
MAKMGGNRTLKRYSAPSWWPVRRKESAWVVKPSPGPYSSSTSLPLLLVLRDLMGITRNLHETRTILNESKIMVNGKVVRRPDFPIGVMDILSIPDMGAHYRVLPYNGSLAAHRIQDSELFRLLRVENKTIVKGLKLQLNLSGGVNMLLDLKDPQDAKNNVYGTLDSLKTDLRGKQILDHLKLDLGSYVLVISGKNSGSHGVLQEIVPAFKRRKSLVRIKASDGGIIETILDYVYVVGREEPIITFQGVE